MATVEQDIETYSNDKTESTISAFPNLVPSDFDSSFSQEAKVTNTDVETRNNREMNFKLSEFWDSGISFVWSRKQLEDYMNPQNKKLFNYNESHFNRRNFKTMSEKINYASHHDVLRCPNQTCEVYFKGKDDYVPKKKVSRTIKIYGVCSQPSCKRFIYTTTFSKTGSGEIVFKVLHDMDNFHHPEPLANQLRGQSRAKSKDKLLHIRPRQFIREADADLSKSTNYTINKNLQKCLSYSAVRQIATEARYELREGKECWDSLVEMAHQKETFIFKLDRKPFNIILMKKCQILHTRDVAKREGPLDVFIDATSTKWKKVIKGPNVHYYSIITRYKNVKSDSAMTVFPIATFFTNDHHLGNLSNNLYRIIRFMRVNCGIDKLNRVIRTITTDFSMALVGSIIEACNGMSVIQYLQHSANWIILKKKNPNFDCEKVILKLCTSHVVKCMFNDLEKYFPVELVSNKQICKIALCQAFNFNDLDEINELFMNVWSFLITKCPEKRCQQYEKLQKQIQCFNDVENYGKDEKCHPKVDMDRFYKCKSDEETAKRKTIYNSSPFYIKCKADYESQILLEFGSKQKVDEYYNSSTHKFIQNFLQKYVTYLPFWTPLLTYREYPDISNLKIKQQLNRANNGPIEGYHHVLKKILKNHLRLVLEK